MVAIINVACTLLILSFGRLAHGWRERQSFEHFFPDVEAELSKAITDKCSGVVQKYRHEHVKLYSVYCVKAYSCIMNNVSEYTKANMASAAVLLGLTPTILTTLGSSNTELALLSSHRPVLAALLVLGSPALNPIRTFDYHTSVEKFQEKKWRWYFSKHLQKSKLSRTGNNIRVMVQLLLVVGSIANLADRCRNVALNAISVMSCDFSDVVVELWIALALPAYLAGIITFYRRYKMTHPGAWLRYEVTLCATHKSQGIRLENEESRAFIVWSFITSVYTVIHLAAGTLIFSSLSLVGMLTLLSLSKCSRSTCFQTNHHKLTVVRKY